MPEPKAPSLCVTRAQLLEALHEHEVRARAVDPDYLQSLGGRSSISVAEGRTKALWATLNDIIKGKQS